MRPFCDVALFDFMDEPIRRDAVDFDPGEGEFVLAGVAGVVFLMGELAQSDDIGFLLHLDVVCEVPEFGMANEIVVEHDARD